jgi:hypothetical protein
MSVLIATATWGNVMRPETRKSIKATRFADKWQWYLSKHNPFPAPDRRNYLAQYEHIREKALAEGWDALLLVEHDMEIPPDALQKLWDTGSQVAYGVYLLRHGANVVNAYEYIGAKNIGESLSMWPKRLATARKEEVARVSGVGFGCTLIRRETLERIPFRSNDKGTAAPDVPFAQDVLAAGIESVAHFGVLCGHWQTWRMLEPFKDEREPTQLVRANQSVNIMVSGQSFPLVKGQEYHLAEEKAADLARLAYVTILEVATEGKGRIAIPRNPDKNIRAASQGIATQPAKSGRTNKQGLGANAAP